jgi:signal transduction histidine kinase
MSSEKPLENIEVQGRTSLREMELLKAELLATVSHELRSPLASIKGYTATLLRHARRLSPEEQHEFLLAIYDASDRLALIVDRLLEMSQLETGAITLHLSEVDPIYLAREAILASEQRCAGQETNESSSHYTFILQPEDEQGHVTESVPLILADRQRLREVLDNLFENAIKFSPEGGTIQIALRPLWSPIQLQNNPTDIDRPRPNGHVAPTHLEIRVHDHGVGIPPEHLERIFDRFHRVDTRLIREVNGLGLGLAICKYIVALHHGSIWAESEVGKGSIFHIVLPRETGW